MLEQDPHTSKLSASLDLEGFRKKLDDILAERRQSVEERNPWWIPSASAPEVVVTPTGRDKQTEGRSPHPAGCYMSTSTPSLWLHGCDVPGSSSYLRFGC